MIAAKTRVGWPEEPHLRGVLVSGIQEECRHPWERKVYPSVLGVGWSVKARRTLRMGTFTASHVG